MNLNMYVPWRTFKIVYLRNLFILNTESLADDSVAHTLPRHTLCECYLHILEWS